MSSVTGFNRLKEENSLYLKQHENNPVHWWPYSPEAIQKAKDENKPIFLSIGYSSCHWCHVMAHESFEDKQTAEYMNENFINIKIDKEEFPDIDQYYQKAAQAYGRQGGWPLSAFLTPEMKPFFVGTYFPKEAKDGAPSFIEVLAELKRAYSEDKESVETNSAGATEIVEREQVIEQKVEFEGHYPPPASVLNALKEFQDSDDGGWGDAPKFPHFAFLEWAVEHIAEGMVPQEFVDHVLNSIDRMFMGGVHDHLRGGFHRYSVDKKWLVPHFEKMLYDQAGMIRLLAKTTVIYPSPLLFDSLIQTLDYLKSEMLSDDKFFFSAQDADSEGIEGLYHTFTAQEFEEIIKASENQDLIDNLENIKSWFPMEESGNFDRGLNVVSMNWDKREDFFQPENWERVRAVKNLLLEERKMRIPPGTDNKGVASWNFMLGSALCDVIQYTKIEVIRNMATELLNYIMEGIHTQFIVANEEIQKSMLKHTTTKDSSLPYFEDYVFFADLQLRVYEITGNAVFRDNCRDTLNYVFNDFQKDGKFYTRSIAFDDSAEYANLEVNAFDQSFKSPLSTLMTLIRRFATLELDREYLDKMEDIKEFMTHLSLQHPLAHGEALRALTYPDDVYRKITVPKKWLFEGEFTRFLPHFSQRFVLEYHEDENVKWQICTLKECELQGDGIEEFIKVFDTPVESDENE